MSYFINENGCHIWTGRVGTHGYGLDGKRLAHRLAWENEHGPIPRDKFVCHHCDVRLCTNVEHMFLGTQAENMQDASAKGRLNPKSLLNLHGRRPGYRSEKRRFTDEEVAAMRQRWEDGETQVSIAAAIGISQGHLSNIIRRRMYR